jgi:hypothetical protein
MRVFAALLLLAGCQDLHDFRGAWHGTLSGDPELAVGATPTVEMLITEIDQQQLAGTINGQPFSSLRHAAGDALADVRVGPSALRTYFGFLSASMLAIVSVYPDRRVEVRLIQGNDLYGVYYLGR